MTVSALLTEIALRRMGSGNYFFCSSAECPIVYFNSDGDTFSIADVRLPVWQKLPPGTRMICYCFGENERDIRTEIEERGRSAAEQRVRDHITAGRCACELRNPRGNCCLSDVIAAMNRAGEAVVLEKQTP
jgi:hypothetical protein